MIDNDDLGTGNRRDGMIARIRHLEDLEDTKIGGVTFDQTRCVGMMVRRLGIKGT